MHMYLFAYVQVRVPSTLVHFISDSCDILYNPSNGMVRTNGTTSPGSIAQYTCNDGYVLVGNETRTCDSTWSWSGTEPVCNRKYNYSVTCSIHSSSTKV